MKRITLAILWAFFALAQTAFSQTHQRIKVNALSHSQIHELADAGIDLRCGAIINEEGVQLELSPYEIERVQAANINYTVLVEDLNKYYSERAIRDKETYVHSKSDNSGISGARSISNAIVDNYLQYNECEEVDWVEPTNFELGVDFGGCLTVQETLDQLDLMRTMYPNLISQRLDASPSNQKTWGNPANTTSNPQYTGGVGQNNDPLGEPENYIGEGTTRWDPQTVWYVRITGDQAAMEGTRPQILYTSMIHSREVSSLMNNMYFMWYLLENYDTDPAIKNLVDNNELYFIPIVNPDGLRWNQALNSSGGTLQRKNLRPNTGSSQNRGVDLNRNFDYLWGADGDSSGSDDVPSSNLYRGPYPFSEPESQILRDFVLARSIETCLMHHSAANSIPHPYGGIPTRVSGREDEMHKWHEDMTKYNRYVSGATIFPAANGIADDWMLGGTPDGGNTTSNANNSFVNDSSPATSGSGQSILATTPEHGSFGSEGGFWPTRAQIRAIAKRAVRINLMNAYHGGQYAKFHDLTQSDINSLTSDLTFGIERIGQSSSNFQLTVTPISSNIISIASIPTQTGMSILEQREVTAEMVLTNTIQPNDKIEYNVQLSDGTNVFFNANFEKYYQPSVVFSDDAEGNNIAANWNINITAGSTSWSTSSNAQARYNGSFGMKLGGTGITSYGASDGNTLTTNTGYDLSSFDEVFVQFYTKWDLERNFDFVEFEGSLDGTNWVRLCGKYNKPNATSFTNEHAAKSATNESFQDNNNSSGQIYDGDQFDNWVMEEISISAVDNSALLNAPNARFRFRFRSDSNNRFENYSANAEGFFIDDFKIIGVNIPCDDTNPPSNLSAGNITATSADISWDNITSATFDIRYRITGTSTWTTITDISGASQAISSLDPNTEYEVQVATRCNTTTSAFSASELFMTLDPCNNTISTYPYTEDFESSVNGGLGLWEQDTSDTGDWTINTANETDGTTPSGSTGPDGDYNPANPTVNRASGHYFYIESSNPGISNGAVGTDAVVNLISPCIDLTGRENATFSFFYHMFGSATGDLTVAVSDDFGSSWTTISDTNVTTNGINPGQNPISGQQQTSSSASWRQQVVDISAYDNSIILIRISAETVPAGTSNSFRGDMGIDYINLTSDAAATGPTVITQNITVNLDATGNITIAENAVDNGSTGAGTLTFDTDITSFTCADIGANTVTLTVTDDNGSDSATATVTVVDNLAPVPDVASLPDATGQCSATIASAPTATDNCGGTITGTTTDSLTSSTQGTTTVTWTFDDGNGNTSTQTQDIVVNDTTAPVPDAASLPDATGQCSATIASAPTATDNCGGTITGTTTDSLT
ncbi:MAG: hypothetical protein ED556_09575, partial [Winogradskyella sp.]|uniref:M14 family zinc carboxypeptidase n=1 Tax=Winogradskyella sp. TaxID=1883156 RepID=UPI000F3EC4F0